MTRDEHIAEHKRLHRALDQLITDFARNTGKLFDETTVTELMQWSHRQTIKPSDPPPLIPVPADERPFYETDQPAFPGQPGSFSNTGGYVMSREAIEGAIETVKKATTPQNSGVVAHWHKGDRTACGGAPAMTPGALVDDGSKATCPACRAEWERL